MASDLDRVLALAADMGVQTKYPESERFADPARKKYPVTKGGKLDAGRIRSAWGYIHHGDNREGYSSSQLASIEGVIRSAAKEAGVELAD
jgi:hypothetical protein